MKRHPLGAPAHMLVALARAGAVMAVYGRFRVEIPAHVARRFGLDARRIQRVLAGANGLLRDRR